MEVLFSVGLLKALLCLCAPGTVLAVTVSRYPLSPIFKGSLRGLKKYCLSLGSYHKIIIDWVVYKTIEEVVSGGCQSKIKAAAESALLESLLSSSLVLT